MDQNGLLQEVSHARTSQSQEKEPDFPEVDPVFGLRCKELLASYDQDTQSWKTSRPSLFEDSTESLDRLPTSGMMQSGRLYRLETLELPTCESEFGSLPTPRNNKVQCVTPNLANRNKSNLEEWVAKINFPTPTKSDAMGGIAKGTANQKESTGMRKSGAKIGASLKWFKLITDTYNGKGHLNPNLCEWLMGFPINWTELEPVGTQSSQG